MYCPLFLAYRPLFFDFFFFLFGFESTTGGFLTFRSKLPEGLSLTRVSKPFSACVFLAESASVKLPKVFSTVQGLPSEDFDGDVVIFSSLYEKLVMFALTYCDTEGFPERDLVVYFVYDSVIESNTAL